MYSKFFGLEKEKQDRIINAASAEFAKAGYDNASTNEIVKQAEISKGILFHYFKNKKQLFLFLYDYLMELCLKDFYDKIDLSDRDIINRLHQAMNIKLELMNIYPSAFPFFETAYVEKSPAVRVEVEERNLKLLSSNYTKIFSNIDVSLFKENLNVEKTINIIMWSLTSLSNALIGGTGNKLQLDYDSAFKEANEYIEMFKKCFYK